MIIRRGIKIVQYVSNEYAQSTYIQVPGGEKPWVGNLYLPPAQNMQKRGNSEEEARSFIEDIMGSIPGNTNSVMYGDWNARMGELSP